MSQSCKSLDVQLGLLGLLLTAKHGLATRLADLVGADPFTLNGPSTEALMVGIVASEVTVFDEATASVATAEVDDLELHMYGLHVHSQSAPLRFLPGTF